MAFAFFFYLRNLRNLRIALLPNTSRLTNEIPRRTSRVSLGCGQHHSLTSCLFVLAAFFIAAAIAASVRIKITLSFAILIAVLATRGPIVLRVSSRRMLASALASALLNPLISLSVVCHTFPLWNLSSN